MYAIRMATYIYLIYRENNNSEHGTINRMCQSSKENRIGYRVAWLANCFCSHFAGKKNHL